jgi:hypothetical protein
MRLIYAIDAVGNVFSFDPNSPNVKTWTARQRLSGVNQLYRNLYLVGAIPADEFKATHKAERECRQWYYQEVDWAREVLGLEPRTTPNYARFFTREQARDFFLGAGIPLPDELSDLRPRTEPTPLSGGAPNDPQPKVYTGPAEESAADATPPPPAKQAAKKTKGKRIDERMLAAIRDNPQSMYWSAATWKTNLHCSKSTVIESKTWQQTCRPARERERLARGKRLRTKKPR